MEPNWAAEHLQVIRTLMERSALYRRALAPVMLLTGVIGLLAASAGGFLQIDSPRGFVGYWLSVSLLPLIGSFVLVRRQALRDAEPFWSPPTRRVLQALLPPFAAGFIVGVILLFHLTGLDTRSASVLAMLWLPLGWVVLYGCAIHAAGFFMPRGMKVFGWVILLGGCGIFALGIPDIPRPWYAHGIMGVFFGALHLAYGVYLYFTESKTPAP
ncbi:MAG: hypothetical protein HY043_04670 [Verrucomicrobia bacterium]|nr:hypothetical protein [Verrucomicrobiota bacterium]